VGLTVEESGTAPDLKVAVTSPGVYRAVVAQSYGGGITQFFDLATDPEAKANLAGDMCGLFEVGWHGTQWKRPEGADPKTCCVNHSLGMDAAKPCTDGTRWWPAGNHQERKCQGELAVIEKSPARVRVQATSWFTSYNCPLPGEVDRDLPVTVVYTFYPSGRILAQVRIQRTGALAYHWGSEYGPHLFLIHQRLPLAAGEMEADQKYRNFTLGTPKHAEFEKDVKAGTAKWAQPEELALAWSDTIKTRLFIAIPPEGQKTFDRHMRHTYPGSWDRFGYGSASVIMPPGTDSTWACVIQMAAEAGAPAATFKTAAEALPYALDYREPAKIEGAQLVKDDSGDFNKDGYNESEGCHVLKGPGSLSFTYEKGKGAGFAPVFKVVGWQGEAPKVVKVDGKEVRAASAVVDGKLVVQVMGTVAGEKVKIQIGG
jgi:hypothetical protein